MECDLKAGLAIGYNCKKIPWHEILYAFFTLDPEVDGVYVSGRCFKRTEFLMITFIQHSEQRWKESASCDSRNPVLDVGSNLGSLALAAASITVARYTRLKDIACRVRMSLLQTL